MFSSCSCYPALCCFEVSGLKGAYSGTGEHKGNKLSGDSLFTIWGAHLRGALVAQTGKESACNAGDPGSIPGRGRSPGVGNGNPFQYSWLENPHGQRSLALYSPWGRKEVDKTERLTSLI